MTEAHRAPVIPRVFLTEDLGEITSGTRDEPTRIFHSSTFDLDF
jgi:hypothetical protein